MKTTNVKSKQNLFRKTNSILKNNLLGLINNGEHGALIEQLEPRLLLSGTTYVVDTLNDVVANDGHVSLREAILASNNNTAVNEAAAGNSADQDIITFANSLYNNGTASIELSAGPLQLNDDVSIQGGTTNKLTLTGNNSLVSAAGVTAEIKDITLQNDLIVQGNLTLNNVTTDHSITMDGGTLTLINSTISNTTITKTNAVGTVTSIGSTFDNVTLNADLTVEGDSFITHGLVLNSTLTLGSESMGGASVICYGNQEITGSGRIDFAQDWSYLLVNGDNNPPPPIFVDDTPVFADGIPSILTIGSDVTLHLSSSLAFIEGDTLINQGTIIADTYRGTHDISCSSLVNDGSISAVNGANLTLNNLTNHAGHTVSVAGGGFLYLNVMNNEGTISADSSTMEMSDGWGNSGVLSATHSTVNFGGTFKLSDVGTFNRSGGTVNLTGVLDNTGKTLLVDTAFSGGFALSYGTIRGGVVDASDANYVMETSSGTLDNVTLNTDLAVSKLLGSLAITNGITLNSTLTLSGYNSDLYFNGNQILSGTGKVLLSGGLSSLNIQDSSILTMSSGITLQATGYIGQYISGSSGTLINQGTIIADTPGGSFLYINTSSLVNDGVISAVSGANLAIQNLTNHTGCTTSIKGGGTLTLTTVNNSGTISADSSTLNINSGWLNNSVLSASNATVNFGGSFKLSDIGTFIRQGGTVNLTGTLDNTGSTLLVDSAFQGGVNLAGGTIKGGVIDATNANYVLRSTGGTLDRVTLNADLNLAAYKTLVVTNGLTLNSTLTLDGSYSYLNFNGTQPLAGSGQVAFVGFYSELRVTGSNSTAATLTVGANITLTASNYAAINGSYGSLVNDGNILAGTSGKTLTFSNLTSLVNNGSISASNGAAITLRGSVTINGTNRISSHSGGIINITGNLLGDTRNSSLYTPQGTTCFNGSGTSTNPQLLEVMSQDLGTAATGFQQNFAYGTLSLTNNTIVKLVDQSDNATGSSNEALYVNSLIVAAGSTLNLNGFTLYTRAAQILGTVTGGTVVQIPDSGPLVFNTATPGTIAVAGELDEWTFYGRSGRTIAIAVNTGATGNNPALSPAVGYVQVTLIDAIGNIVATGSNTSAGQIVTLNNITLPADGTYRLQIRASQGHLANTGNYTVSAYDITSDVASLVFNQQKIGAIESPFGTDQWTFTATAGQQISLNLIKSTTPGLVFDLTGPSGWEEITGVSTNADPINLTATGAYTLTAHSSNGQHGGAYTFKVVQTSQTELTSGVAYNGTFAASGQAQLFKVNLSKSSPLLIQLNDSSAADHTEVYVKFGSAPTRADYDYCTTSSSSPNQQLLLPMASSGACYILVYGNTIPTASNYTLTATASDVFLDSVTPDQAGTGTDSVLTLSGAGFVAGTSVALVNAAGTSYAATSLKIDSFSRMTATFGAGTVPAGSYSVVVTSAAGDTAQLSDAFTMVQGGQAHLETQLIIPGSLGRRATATLYIEYTNTGDIAMDAPLLVLASGDADDSDKPLLTLNQSLMPQGYWTSATPEGFSDSIMILASGSTPGLLQPGETVRVPVYYAGLLNNASHWWDITDNQVEFSLGVLSSDNTTTIDWTTLETSMQPASMTDAEWNPIWSNFINQTGTTWGDYVSMLDANAAYLGTLGESVNDISQLLAFEFAQADGLGPMRTLTSAIDASVEASGIAITFSRFFAGSISLRNDLTTLGYGWSSNWDYSLATSSDGTVTITGPGGSTRSFQPDSRTAGKYFSSLGDYGTLTTRSSGGYTLRESDGSLYAFKADGSLDYVEDTNANRITCGYTDGLLTSLTHSSGQYLHLSYTGGLLTGLVDQDGCTTSYSYDSSQRLISVTDDTGAVTGYSYSGHDLTSVAYPGATHRYFTYDSQGRIASASLDQDINKVSFSYDSAGTVFLTDALGNTTELYYDYRGLLVKATDPLGNIVSLSFDGNNNLTSITDAAGHSSYYSYDKKGNLIRSTDAAGNTTSMTYSGLYNRLSSLTDANGNTTLYSYDTNGNLSSITYANGANEQWSYNTLGSPTEWVNCRGSEVGYTYDRAGRILSKLYADGTTATFTYDSHGNLRTATNSDGATTFTYNSKDELTRVDYPGGQYLIFTYDAGGRRTSSTDQLGHKTNYQYDVAGRLSKVTDENGTVLAAYSYDAAGRLSHKDLGNGVYTTYGYDAAGQLLHLINYNTDGSVMSRFDYSYDSRGRRTSMTTVDGAWTYEYDDIGQLTHAVFASNDPANIADQDLRYVYDAMGNRIQTIENGIFTDYTVNNLNQYTKVGDTTYVFDLDGNLIQEIAASGTTTYTYNSENQLTGISSPEGTWSYGYDALGNRVTTTANGVTTTSVIDPAGLGNIVGVYDAAGNLLTSYSYGYGLLTALSGANLAYYTFDALGSTSELTDASGRVVNSYVYNPFGSVVQESETVANVFDFVGESGVIDDRNGLMYMRAREYDAGVGRFTQEDPINVLGGVNLYAYTKNSPIYQVDPSGKFAVGVFIPILLIQSSRLMAGMVLSSRVVMWAESHPNELGKLVEGFGKGIAEGYEHQPPSLEQTPWGNIGKAAGVLAGSGAKAIKDLANNSANNSSGVANSVDPNILTGPSGYGTDNHLTTNSPFAYRIDFENDKTATAPAQQVTITNQLDADLDWSSFQLTEIAFGDTIISVPAGSSHFETTVAMTYNNKTFNVLIEAGINYATGLVTATFQSLDPEIELPPDVLTGFLPPEDGTGRGMGHVSYLIKAKQGLATGTQIRNIALISFDGQTLIATNQVDPHDASKGTDPDLEALVTIDNDKPSSSVTALPATTTTTDFLVAWSGNDVGSGIASYDVYVAMDNGAWTLWQNSTSQTSATYTGEAGHSYSFYCIAKDNVGLAEHKSPVVEASTLVEETTPQTMLVSTAALAISEGGNGTFTLQLSKQPSSDLVVNIARTSGEASITTDVTSLTFTVANWNQAQTVTVSAPSDSNLAASTATFTLSAEGMASQTVTVNAADADVQALVLTNQTLNLSEGGSGTFSVALAYQPAADTVVTIARTSGDATITTSLTTLTFTAANWNQAQTVTVSAPADTNLAASAATFTFSAEGMASQTVTVNAADADVQALVLTNQTLNLTEGGSGTFSVALAYQPATDTVVTIARTSGDATITTNLTTLTFTAANWNQAQTVTVSAASDNNLIASAATFTLSAPGIASQAVTVSAADADVQALVISQPSLLLAEGETGTIGISLAYQPSSTVTVTITRSSGDATISATTTTLSFTAANWNVAQQLSFTAALDDNLTNSSAVFTISALDAASKTVAITAVDADATTLIVTPANLNIEEGGNGTFQVRLAYKPDANVTVSVARTSGDSTLNASVASLTFTPTNWNVMQTVTVSAPTDSNQSASTAVFTVSVPTYKSQQLTARLAQMGRKMSLPRVMTQTVTVTASDADIQPLRISSSSLRATSAAPLAASTATVSTTAANNTSISSVKTTATVGVSSLKQASRAQATNLFTLVGNLDDSNTQEGWHEAAHALTQYQQARKSTPIAIPQQWLKNW